MPVIAARSLGVSRRSGGIRCLTATGSDMEVLLREVGKEPCTALRVAVMAPGVHPLESASFDANASHSHRLTRATHLRRGARALAYEPPQGLDG